MVHDDSQSALNTVKIHGYLLLSEKCHPRETKIVSVYKHILDKQVWRTTMLLKQNQTMNH